MGVSIPRNRVGLFTDLHVYDPNASQTGHQLTGSHELMTQTTTERASQVHSRFGIVHFSGKPKQTIIIADLSGIILE
jgi:hypothetical protein